MDTNKFLKPYVIFSNGIGDHFLVLPAVRALSRIFQGRLSLICEKHSYTKIIFKEIEFRNIVEISFFEDEKGRRFDYNDLYSKICDCDFLISLNPWGYGLDIVDLLKRLNLKSSIGFYDHFQITVPFDSEKHNIDLNFDIPKRLQKELNINDFLSKPDFGSEFEKLRGRLRKRVLEDVKLLALHVDTEKSKMWSGKGYIEALETFCAANPNYGIVIVGQETLEIQNSSISDYVLDFNDSPLPFFVACAIVSISDMFLGIDSVFLHVADFYEVPSVSLFGPTSPIEFGSRIAKNKYIYPKSRNINDITSTEVCFALKEILNQ